MRLHHAGRNLELHAQETVLECLERHGVTVPSSCRSGVCQTCLLRSVEGEVPDAAQIGLKPVRRRQGYFLACLCRPTADLKLSGEDETFESRIVKTERLAPDVYRVWLQRPSDFDFEAGQFLQVIRSGDGLTRPYSIASLPERGLLELHVALAPMGAMSRWLPTATGTVVRIRGPFGACTYPDGDPSRPLVLAGTGTGMAPLCGVLRCALSRGHRGRIRVLHGARTANDLYAKPILEALAREHSSIETTYHTPRLDDGSPLSAIVGALTERAALAAVSTTPDAHAFVCGNPTFVRSLRRSLYLAGLALSDIHSDAFVSSPLPVQHTGT